MNRFRAGQKVKYSLKKDAVGIVEKILFVRGTERVNYLIKYADERFLVHAEGHLLEAVVIAGHMKRILNMQTEPKFKKGDLVNIIGNILRTEYPKVGWVITEINKRYNIYSINHPSTSNSVLVREDEVEHVQ